MRRSDREIKDRATIDRVLHAATVCRLALCDGERPYIIPMSYGYDGNCLYFHCASQGRKLDLIRRNPNGGFEVDVGVEIVRGAAACSWGLRYQSVVGSGRVTVVADLEEKRRGLAALMAHYGGTDDGVPDEAIRSLCILRLDVAEVSGKTAG
ncbi:MAG: pyridoxamine 5'-phosphate oxidase family protein [Candidatus Bipolaricaulis sp.]|nr:pyridoxamine 5'-phosphate oxidase family protein [Candidatus Bipolaricaulis sp.]